MEYKVKKAIIPVAGLGTRFLPFTKTIPKEMLPIINRPTIDYIVEEAVASGIEEIIFITSSTKVALVNYFDRNFELEQQLINKGKYALVEQIKEVTKRARILTIRQYKALGLGHAVLQAKCIINDEPFALLLGDDVIYNPDEPVLKQMINVSEKYKTSVLGVGKVSKKSVSSYGIIEPKKEIKKGLWELGGVVEKPKVGSAPSNYSIMGRYILDSKIFKYLEEKNIDISTDEIQITDSILKLMNSQKILALEFNGKRYDMGSKLGFLKANIEYGLRDIEIKENFHKYLKNLINKKIN